MITHFGQLVWVDDTRASSMPNEMRKLVGEDEDLFVVMASPWADDVSGNKSKQYNKHMNMYTGNGCLPGRLLQQEYHVHYVSTSPNASSAEQFTAFRDQVQSTGKQPVRCYNAATNRISRFIIRAPGLTILSNRKKRPIWAVMQTSLAENVIGAVHKSRRRRKRNITNAIWQELPETLPKFGRIWRNSFDYQCLGTRSL
jgi:hypothetical protein